MPHGQLRCAVATIAALHGEEVGGLPGLVERALEHREPVSSDERWLVAGAGRDWPTAQEAVLKLREGSYVAAEAHETEQLLHGHLAAIDESVRAFVLEGEGRAAERARGAAAALRELGCETTLVPTVHPVADIVRFQLLTLDLAEARGIDPDKIHRDDPRWARAKRCLRAERPGSSASRSRRQPARRRRWRRARACRGRVSIERAEGEAGGDRAGDVDPCIAAAPGSEIQSGSSIHSPTSCSLSSSSETHSKLASLLLTSRQVSSVSRQLRPGCVAL